MHWLSSTFRIALIGLFVFSGGVRAQDSLGKASGTWDLLGTLHTFRAAFPDFTSWTSAIRLSLLNSHGTTAWPLVSA